MYSVKGGISISNAMKHTNECAALIVYMEIHQHIGTYCGPGVAGLSPHLPDNNIQFLRFIPHRVFRWLDSRPFSATAVHFVEYKMQEE